MGKYDLTTRVVIKGEVAYEAEITAFVAAKVIALLSQIEAGGTDEVRVAPQTSNSIDGGEDEV